jgi:tetratricopeptide (TPR) repeat protein
MVRGRAEEAAIESLTAMQLEPFTLVLLWNAGIFHYLARKYDDAIELSQKGLELDPKFAPFRWTLAFAFVQKQNYTQAVYEAEEAVQISHRAPFFLGALGHVYSAVGRTEDALKVISELANLSYRRHVSPYWRGMTYAIFPEKKDEAFLWLERALQNHAPWMVYLKAPPWFDNLRSDSRYYNLLQRMNIPI